MLSGASVPPPKDLFLDVKDKILTIDLPQELRAKFNSLLELLFGQSNQQQLRVTGCTATTLLFFGLETG